MGAPIESIAARVMQICFQSGTRFTLNRRLEAPRAPGPPGTLVHSMPASSELGTRQCRPERSLTSFFVAVTAISWRSHVGPNPGGVKVHARESLRRIAATLNSVDQPASLCPPFGGLQKRCGAAERRSAEALARLRAGVRLREQRGAYPAHSKRALDYLCTSRGRAPSGRCRDRQAPRARDRWSAPKDVLLDATFIANSSWIRAFLWTFLFALRQKTINRIGYNPLQLLVLDDPQSTLDLAHRLQLSAIVWPS